MRDQDANSSEEGTTWKARSIAILHCFALFRPISLGGGIGFIGFCPEDVVDRFGREGSQGSPVQNGEIRATALPQTTTFGGHDGTWSDCPPAVDQKVRPADGYMEFFVVPFIVWTEPHFSEARQSWIIRDLETTPRTEARQSPCHPCRWEAHQDPPEERTKRDCKLDFLCLDVSIV